MISHVPVPPIDPAMVRDLDPGMGKLPLIGVLQHLATTHFEARVIDLDAIEHLPTA
jgi:hypothetical protein